MPVQTVDPQWLSEPGVKDRAGSGADEGENVIFAGCVRNLHIFHNQEFVKHLTQPGYARTFQRKPESVLVGQYVHLRHNFPLGGQMRRITAAAWRQLLDIVRDHALQPGCALAAGEL